MAFVKGLSGTVKVWWYLLKAKFKRNEPDRKIELAMLIDIAVSNQLTSLSMDGIAFTINPGRYMPKEQLNLDTLKVKSKTAQELKAEREKLLFWSAR